MRKRREHHRSHAPPNNTGVQVQSREQQDDRMTAPRARGCPSLRPASPPGGCFPTCRWRPEGWVSGSLNRGLFYALTAVPGTSGFLSFHFMLRRTGMRTLKSWQALGSRKGGAIPGPHGASKPQPPRPQQCRAGPQQRAAPTRTPSHPGTPVSTPARQDLLAM